MNENPEPGVAPPQRGGGLSFVRRFVYPAVVIAAIIGVIVWLEVRDSGAGTSPTGERYGPADLPAALVPAGARVAAEEGALAPDFLLETLEGDDLRLSDYRGRAVILNFWATWCAPCRKEIPQFVDAHSRYQDDGLAIIAVNLQEGKAVVRPYAEDFGMDFPIVFDRAGRVSDRYRLLGLPVTYFIGRDGVIDSVFIGPFEETERGTSVQGAIDASDLEQRIAAILGSAEDSDGSR